MAKDALHILEAEITRQFLRVQLRRIGLPERIIGSIEASASDDLRARIVGSVSAGEISHCFAEWQAAEKIAIDEYE